MGLEAPGEVGGGGREDGGGSVFAGDRQNRIVTPQHRGVCGGGLSPRLPAVSGSSGCIPPGLAFSCLRLELSVFGLENQSLCCGAGERSLTQVWELVPPLRTAIPKSSWNAPLRGHSSHPLLPHGLLGSSQDSLARVLAQPRPCTPAAPCSGEEEEEEEGGSWVYFAEPSPARPDRPCCRGDTCAAPATTAGCCKPCSLSIGRWYRCWV